MSSETIQVIDDHPTIPEAHIHYYVTVHYDLVNSDWFWGASKIKNPPAHGPFPTEDLAMADSESHFGGVII